MLGTAMLTTMFDYNGAMNARLLACASQVSDEQLDAPKEYSQGGVRATLWHLLIVEYGWRSQCQGVDARKEPLPIEQTASVATLQVFQQAEHARTQRYIADASEDDLTAPITLTRRNGSTFAVARWQVLSHILFHSAQHRSELAEMLTQYGHSPGDTDYIFYIAPPSSS